MNSKEWTHFGQRTNLCCPWSVTSNCMLRFVHESFYFSSLDFPCWKLKAAFVKSSFHPHEFDVLQKKKFTAICMDETQKCHFFLADTKNIQNQNVNWKWKNQSHNTRNVQRWKNTAKENNLLSVNGRPKSSEANQNHANAQLSVRVAFISPFTITNTNTTFLCLHFALNKPFLFKFGWPVITKLSWTSFDKWTKNKSWAMRSTFYVKWIQM